MEIGDEGWARSVVSRFAGGTDIEPADIAGLANQLAASGDIRSGGHGENDVASTGGPGSLSTFLSPLYMRVDGDRVPKVGVPGRPAGVVDALGSVPGYEVEVSGDGFERILQECGFANALATGRLAPADGQLFIERQRLGAQTVPALVVASLLSKKVAVGLDRCTIDIRVGEYGNFGRTVPEAEANARLITEVGRLLNISVTPFISTVADGQPYLGRLEALMALQAVASESADSWLKAHANECLRIARSHDLRLRSQPAPSPSAIAAALDANLRAQGVEGGLMSLSLYIGTKYKSASVTWLRAPQAGRVKWDYAKLRTAIVEEQRLEGGRFADPAGVQLLRSSGTVVEQGEEIAIVRHQRAQRLDTFAVAVGRAPSIL